MSSFKVIYRVDLSDPTSNLIWEEGCSLLILKYQVSRNVKTSDAYLQAELRNISDLEISSYQIKGLITFEDGILEEVSIDALDADVPAGAFCSIKPARLSRGDVKSVKLTVEKTVSPGKSWQSSNEALPLQRKRVIGLSETAMSERLCQLRESGCTKPEEAVDYQCISNDGWWVCSCGEPNVGTTNCVRCGLNHKFEESLREESSLEELRAKRHLKMVMDKASHEARMAQMKRVAGGCAILICIAFFFALYLVPYQIQPAVKYSDAQRLFDSGEYEEAESEFASLGDYRDSSDKASESRNRRLEESYQSAKKLLDEGSYSEASQLFAAISDYKDSNSKAREASDLEEYRKAQSYYGEKDYKSALSCYAKILNKNSAMRISEDETKNAYAAQLIKQNELTEALDLISKIEQKSEEVTAYENQISDLQERYGAWLGKWTSTKSLKLDQSSGEWLLDKDAFKYWFRIIYRNGKMQLFIEKGRSTDGKTLGYLSLESPEHRFEDGERKEGLKDYVFYNYVDDGDGFTITDAYRAKATLEDGVLVITSLGEPGNVSEYGKADDAWYTDGSYSK